MNGEFENRLKLLFESQNLDKKGVAEILNINLKSVYNILSGKTFPSKKIFNAIGNAFPKLNFHWLWTGEGEMFDATPDSISIPEKKIERSIFTSEDFAILREEKQEAIKQKEAYIEVLKEKLVLYEENSTLLKEVKANYNKEINNLKKEIKELKAVIEQLKNNQ